MEVQLKARSCSPHPTGSYNYTVSGMFADSSLTLMHGAFTDGAMLRSMTGKEPLFTVFNRSQLESAVLILLDETRFHGPLATQAV